jgi:hypothetical protein
MLFSWDASLLKDVASDPPYKLTASGITAVSAASECRDQSCVALGSEAYLQLPAHNFGQYAGLTFALWFKPKEGSGRGATLLDFGKGPDQDNIVVARKDETSQLLFTVRITALGQSSMYAGTSAWQTNVWKHVAWTLEPTTGTGATWKIYVDGEQIASVDGLYPVNAELTQNYLGKGSRATDSPFVGYMDSLVIFGSAVDAAHVLVLVTVSAGSVCFYTYAKFCV